MISTQRNQQYDDERNYQQGRLVWKWNRLRARGRQPKVERTVQSFLLMCIVMCCLIDVGNTQFISEAQHNGHSINSLDAKDSLRAAKMARLDAQLLSQLKDTPRQVTSTSQQISSSCHDNQLYRNPINGRDCAQHKNSSCIYHDGLTDTQIINLIKSCPISCSVPCESSFNQPTSPPVVPSVPPSDDWRSRQFDIEFYISSIPSLMTEDTEQNFELYMFNYLSSSLIKSETISNTTIESLSLKSQELVGSRRLRMRDTRYRKSITHERALSSSPILNVVISISALSLNTNGEELKLFFLEAVDDSQGIEHILRLDAFFENATVSSRPPKGPKQSTKQSTTTVNIVILSSVLLIICIAVIIGFVHHRYSRMKPFNYAAEDSSQTNSDSEDIENSITELNTIPSHLVNNSKQNSQQLTISTNKTATPPKKPSPTEHAFPPMIVIDNIEVEPPTSNNQMESNLSMSMSSEATNDVILPNNDEDNSGMRVKRIEASSAFAEALSEQKSSNPIQMYKLLTSIQSQDDDSDTGISPKSLISSRRSVCDTLSVGSTPVTTKADDKGSFGVSLQEQNLFTFETDNDLDDAEDDFNVMFEKSMKAYGKADGKRFIRFKRMFQMTNQGKRKKNHNDEHSPFKSSHYESDAEQSEESSMMRERDRREISQDQPSSPYQAIDTQTNTLAQQGINEVSAIEESKMVDKADHEPESENFRDESSPCSLDSVARHTRSISRESGCTSHSGSRSASVCSNENLYFYSFLAPSSSKLGITIQSATSTGPVIIQVKDYSPLFGMVQSGDIIISVDDVNTSFMTTRQITELLSIKRSDINMKEIKVTVMSNTKKYGLQPDENEALKYNTISSESAQPVTRENESNEELEACKEGHKFPPYDAISSHQSDSETCGSFHMMAGCDSEDEDSFM